MSQGTVALVKMTCCYIRVLNWIVSYQPEAGCDFMARN